MARTRKNGGIIGRRRETKPFSKSGVWTNEDVVNNRPIGAYRDSEVLKPVENWLNTADYDPYYNMVVYHMDDMQPDHLAKDKTVNYWDESLSPDQYWKIHLPVYSGPRYRDWSTFFGEGGYYQVADKADMRLGTSNFTIEFWFKPARKDATEYYIMGKGGNAGRTSGTGWVVYVSTTYNIGFYDAVSNTSYQASGALSTDTWYHIAIVRSSTGANGLSIYVDGVLQAQGNCASNFTDTSVMYIGRDRVATSTTWSTGWLTDIRICNTARYGSAFTRPSAALDMTTNDVVFSHSMLKPHHDNLPQKHQQYAVITMPGSTLQRMIDSPFVNNATRLTGHGSHAIHLWDGSRSQKIYDNKSFTITATTANVLTVSTTMGLTTGQPILLSGTPFGSLTASQYYVGNITSLTTMTITSTPGGADFATGASASGSMTATNNSLRFGTGAFTVEGWFYFTNNTLTNGLVGKGTGNYGAGGTGWSLLIDSNGWLQWADAASILTGNATGNTGYWTGWYHVAVVRESTATNKFKMYMNGALQYMGTVTTDYNITDDLRLWGTRNDQYTLRGSACGLRISKTARYNADFIVPTTLLTATQTGNTTGNIATIANTAATSLLLNSVSSGTYITDSSNTPVTITATGSPSWNSLTPFSGNVAGSIQFNGSTQYLTAATSPVFAMGTGAFTVEAWVYITSLATVSTIIDFRSAAGNSAFYLSVLTTGALRFFDGPATGTTRDTPTGLITTNTWYHVVATRVNSVLRLFVNGILHYYFPGNTSDYGASTQPITIGRSADSAAYNYFVGYMTGVRIVKGLSVYTSGFDVESTAFIDSSMSTDYNTGILLGTTGNNTPLPNNFQPIDYGSQRNAIWRYQNEFRFGASHPYSRHGYSFFVYGNNAHLLASDAASNFNFSSNDFSVEFWTYQIYGLDTFNTYRYLYDSRVYFNDSGMTIRINAYMKVDVVVNNAPILKDTAVLLTPHTWTHIVVQRVNGNLALYINGRRRCETRYTGTINAPGNKIFFGNGSYPNIQYNSALYGNMADIRLVNGTAAYSGGQIFTTATSVNSNVITVDSTANFVVGRPIVFRGTAFGSIVAGTKYYILTIPSATTITISATVNGATFAAGTGTGSMSVKVNEGYNPEYIRMPTEPTTAIPDTVLLTCGQYPIFRDYSGKGNTVQAGGRNEANFAGNNAWDVYMTNITPYSGKAFDITKVMAGQNHAAEDGYQLRSIGFQGDSTYPELSFITRMTSPWTVEFWCYGHNVNPAAASSQQYWRTATSAGHEGWEFYAHYNGSASSWGDLMFRKWRSADSSNETITTTGGTGQGNYSPHSWNHVVVQFDPSATNKVAMFCNGLRVATRAAFTAGTKSWNTYILGNGQTGVGPIRISNIARYSNDLTTYTIPSEMWPIDANCVVLSNANGPYYPKSASSTTMHYGTSVSYQYKKFGTGSMMFSNKETTLSERIYMGENYWRSHNLTTRRGDFTIECWACWRDAASGGVAPNGTAGNVLWHINNHIWVGINPTGYWKFEQASGGGTAPTYYQRYADTVTPAATAASGRFDHVVVVRRSGDYYFYVNGVEKYIMLMAYWGSYTAGQGPTSNWDADLDNAYMVIGTDNNSDTNTDWTGYVQDFRVTKFARYETKVINNIPTMVHAQTEIPALPTRLFPTK